MAGYTFSTTTSYHIEGAVVLNVSMTAYKPEQLCVHWRAALCTSLGCSTHNPCLPCRL